MALFWGEGGRGGGGEKGGEGGGWWWKGVWVVWKGGGGGVGWQDWGGPAVWLVRFEGVDGVHGSRQSGDRVAHPVPPGAITCIWTRITFIYTHIIFFRLA